MSNRRPRQIALFEPPRQEERVGDLLGGAFPKNTPIEQAHQLSLGDAHGSDLDLRRRSSLRACILGSGSRGNCVVVDYEGRRLLLDAGFSCRELERRLALVGVERESIEAIVVTHEHNDHARGAIRFSKRNAAQVYATRGTLAGKSMRKIADPITIRSGRPFEVAGLEIEGFSIVHDAREPIGLVVRSGDGSSLGLAADLGVRSASNWARLIDLDLLLVESNYDVEMLRSGPYPWVLKQRVASRYGHLSNVDAAKGVREVLSDSLSAVVLYHLSETNNLPALAAAATQEMLERERCRARLVLARQDEPTDWLYADGRCEPLPLETTEVDTKTEEGAESAPSSTAESGA